jgi:hypothetical protein
MGPAEMRRLVLAVGHLKAGLLVRLRDADHQAHVQLQRQRQGLRFLTTDPQAGQPHSVHQLHHGLHMRGWPQSDANAGYARPEAGR